MSTHNSSLKRWLISATEKLARIEARVRSLSIEELFRSNVLEKVKLDLIGSLPPLQKKPQKIELTPHRSGSKRGKRQRELEKTCESPSASAVRRIRKSPKKQ